MKLNKMVNIIAYLMFYSMTLSNSIFGQLTLESCQKKAKNNYPLIQKYDLIEKSKEYSLSNANKAYFPQLSITAIAGIVDGFPEFSLPGQESTSNDYNLISIIQLNQNIWDGGMTGANKAIVEAESGIETADLNVSLFSIEERINNIYFGILLIDERIQLLDIFKDNINRNLRNVKIAVANGSAYKSDIDELTVEILKTDQNATELKFNRDSYVQMLSALIGQVISEDESFTRPEIIDSYSALGIKRPELSLFENQRNLVEARYNMSKSSLYPKIGLMGLGVFINPGINFGPSDITRLMVGGFNLSWEIGGLYKNSSNSQLTQIGLEKINIMQETFLFNTNLELSQTQSEIEKFKFLIEKDIEILKLKTNIKKSYEVKYENGVCTMSELLDRINDENVAGQDKILHKIQQLMTAYKYKNISGN